MDYRTVHLAINLADRVAINPGNPGGDVSECQSGGSTWCFSPSKDCGGTHCVGTSTKRESIETIVSLPADRVEAFQKEFQALLGKFATR